MTVRGPLHPLYNIATAKVPELVWPLPLPPPTYTRTITCTCGAHRHPHTITCLISAAAHGNAMINDDGEVFYPDNRDDADWFATQHDAYPLCLDRWPFITPCPQVPCPQFDD